MARRDTAKPGSNSKRLPIAEQEDAILAVYADMVERGDLNDMFGLMRHAGIALRPDPVTAILRHYWLGLDHGYDLKRAIEDFASWPLIVARCEELRREQRARRAGSATSGSIQTFASHLPHPHLQMFESQEPLANDMFLVELLTLTFENEACCEWVSNVKVAPLGDKCSSGRSPAADALLRAASRSSHARLYSERRECS